jgi:transcription initiation factor IIF auxiliary subunit
VWTTLTLGKQFNAEHCLIIENVPVMMAWLPTTAANTARTRTGHLNFSGKQKSEQMSIIGELLHNLHPTYKNRMS